MLKPIRQTSNDKPPPNTAHPWRADREKKSQMDQYIQHPWRIGRDIEQWTAAA